MEISQLRSGWLKSENDFRPERTMDTGDVKCSAALSGRDDFADTLPATVWLANSGCPSGTKRSVVRSGIGRSAGPKEWGGVGVYKDFAPDGAAASVVISSCRDSVAGAVH